MFTLLIVGPTMVWEEIWRGRPMIDQGGNLWLVPAVVVTLAYFVGGAIAGRHRRRPGGALIQGVALALSTSSVLVTADLVRRIVIGNHQSAAVALLWLAAAAGTILIAVLGSLSGRWLYIRRRARWSA